MSEHFLDASRMLCPLPVIRTQEKVSNLKPGDILQVTCTDPGARNDIPAWCRINGHKVLAIGDANSTITITLEVGRDGT